jgi:hypothetical protein
LGVDCTGEEEGELKLNKGDKVLVLRKALDGWWTGKIGDRTGDFPSMNVRPM